MKEELIKLPQISDLSIDEKIGQLIMVDFSGMELSDEVREKLTSRPWGGVILFAKNVKDREQLTALNRELSGLNDKLPLYISVDQEGGLVNRAEFEGMHIPPGNMALGYADDRDLTEKCAFVSGIELRELGFHLDFAPVADVNINPDNPIIGVRSFGEDPVSVSKHTAAAVHGFERAGIASCAKHFPGHGDTAFDSHLQLARVDASLERIEKVELVPFEGAIAEGVSSIMTAHVVFPALDDEDVPATLSKKILTGLLREKMDFEGLIITDSMSMKAISDNYGVGESAVRAVNAGADIVMMCGTYESQLEAFDALKNAFLEGRIKEEVINGALQRILDFKNKYVCNPWEIPVFSLEEREAVIQEAAGSAARVIYDNSTVLPIIPEGKKAVVLSPDKLYKSLLDETGDQWSIFPHLQYRFGLVERMTYDPSKAADEFAVAGFTPKPDCVFLELYSRGKLSDELREASEGLINRLKSEGIPVIVIMLSSTCGLPETADAALTGYNYSSSSLAAAVDLLFSGESCSEEHICPLDALDIRR